MKQVSTRHQLLKTLLLTLVFFVSLSTNSFAQAQADPVQTGEEQVQDAGATEGAGDPAKGKELFNSLCAACHKRYKNATGPALNGVTDRHERGWIYEWVKKQCRLKSFWRCRGYCNF
jgi:mono/diheme cytochrome c family protein